MLKRFVLAVVAAMVFAVPRLSADDVAASSIVQKWKDTRIDELNCKLLEERKQDGFSRKSQTEFWRNAAYGARIRDEREDSWVVDDIGYTVQARDAEGFAHVSITRPEGSSVEMGYHRFVIWHWIEPDNIRLLSEHLVRLGDQKVPLVNDDVLGHVAKIVIVERQREMTWILSEKYDWRVVEKIDRSAGRPDLVYRFTYDRNQLSQLILVSVAVEGLRKFSVEPGQRSSLPTYSSTQKIAVSDIDFECELELLEQPLPKPSVVQDQVSDPPANYIVRANGSKRFFSNEERKRAGTWQRLHDTDVGDLLK